MNNLTLNMTDVPVSTALQDAEAAIYKYAIQQARYNQAKAARALGVSRGTLRTKLHLYFPGEFLDLPKKEGTL